MSLGYSLSCSKEALICFPRGSPEIPGQIEVGMEKLDFDTKTSNINETKQTYIVSIKCL